VVADKPASPRIFHIEYVTPVRRDARGRFEPRLASAFVKVPYGGVYALTENLTRAMTTGQVERYTLRVARPREITPEIRASLTRWPEALSYTTEVTAVDFSR
jgi:hypothetical protein